MYLGRAGTWRSSNTLLHTLPLTKETELLAEKELVAGVILKLTLMS